MIAQSAKASSSGSPVIVRKRKLGSTSMTCPAMSAKPMKALSSSLKASPYNRWAISSYSSRMEVVTASSRTPSTSASAMARQRALRPKLPMNTLVSTQTITRPLYAADAPPLPKQKFLHPIQRLPVRLPDHSAFPNCAPFSDAQSPSAQRSTRQHRDRRFLDVALVKWEARQSQS